MDRVTLVEQTMQVIQGELRTMQREINEVLGQIHLALQGITRGHAMALETLRLEIQELKSKLLSDDLPATRISGSTTSTIADETRSTSGKEL